MQNKKQEFYKVKPRIEKIKLGYDTYEESKNLKIDGNYNL